MNTKARRSLQVMKAHVKQEKEKVEAQSNWIMDAGKPCSGRGGSIRERKIALQQDVDKLKKRLKHEENIHQALERAFTRPLGALPRLPPYLPPHTFELLAEVAVLEEEVVRLEEKVVHFRQGLYQEAVYISSSKKIVNHSSVLIDPRQINDHKPKQETYSAAIICKNLSSLSDERRGKENHSRTNFSTNKPQSSNSNSKLKNMLKKPPVKCRSEERRLVPPSFQLESRGIDHERSEEKNRIIQEEVSPTDHSSNEVSENLLKCLINIFLRMNSKKSSSSTENSFGSLTFAENNDPYNLCFKFGKRDIGPYKHLVAIEAALINPNRTKISVFLVQRLKLLLQRLATVDLKGLSHQEKLAFWINIYNSCMMNAFLEYGIPESPEMIVELMQKATLNVGGHILNAITIEHFILRLPYHSKDTFSKGTKYDEMRVLGLDLSEPLVTFALSCGSWSSPAVHVYTATQVENELEAAKRDYLQAAIGISTSEKVISIPKLLDWYLLDFTKDFESLVDWICLQLPSEIGKEALKCLESKKTEPLFQCLQIMPHEFSFRYLFKR
ncbi:hypothetical protein CDL12_08211 [Handroanthus impetiginosus]|uniref:Ternary complex factor MIP1 leucine-zipper domain-containing protein n=1 Tax=Handroanthus impetiginosus TaxID=429701 RepID=A0A2G9HP81_9LAMI|nr:hypothetical protein CDL12_08211 [Handroanthus impetiginosus]